MTSNLSLKNKWAIITGGSRGIGAGIALELGKKGANVIIIHSSSSSTLQAQSILKTVVSLPHHPSAHAIVADIRSPSAIASIPSTLASLSISTISILVNNAGVELTRPLGSITPEDFASVYDVNVRGAILVTQAVLPMLTPNGRIINIGSVGARAGFKELSLYCSSKAALEGLTRCWAAELGGNGTTVNTVNPGPVQSEMLDNIPKNIVEGQKKATPMENRVGTVEEVASVVSWLAGEESKWVTGQAISASGGWAMY